MLDGLHDNARLILAGVVCLTAIAWLAVRRVIAGGRRCQPRFCPQCGYDIAARLARRDAVSMARPVSVCEETPRVIASGALPSELLRRGWSRTVQPAADAAGSPVFSDSPDACRFTLWAAGNRCFLPGSRRWGAFFENLQAVLRERYGEGVQIQKWNRSAPDQETVVSVAEEAQRRMRQDYQ